LASFFSSAAAGLAAGASSFSDSDFSPFFAAAFGSAASLASAASFLSFSAPILAPVSLPPFVASATFGS